MFAVADISSHAHGQKRGFPFSQFVKRWAFVIASMAAIATAVDNNEANARGADCARIEFAWDSCPCAVDSCSGPFQMDSRTLFRTDDRMLVKTAGPAVEAAAPVKTVTVAGAWTLVSIYEEDAGGEEMNRFEDDAQGQFITDDNGNFSLQMINLGARRRSATAAYYFDPAGLVDAITYFGSYVLDTGGERLTLRVERCLFKECDLIDQTISIKINGNFMEWISLDTFSTTGAYYRQFVWRRK
jgi:hypothetical protein